MSMYDDLDANSQSSMLVGVPRAVAVTPLRRARPSVSASACAAFDDERGLQELVSSARACDDRLREAQAEVTDLKAEMDVLQSKIERKRKLLQTEEDRRAYEQARASNSYPRLQNAAIPVIRHNAPDCDETTRTCDVDNLKLLASRGHWFVINADCVLRRESGDFWDTIDLETATYAELVAFVRRPAERAVRE